MKTLRSEVIKWCIKNNFNPNKREVVTESERLSKSKTGGRAVGSPSGDSKQVLQTR